MLRSAENLHHRVTAILFVLGWIGLSGNTKGDEPAITSLIVSSYGASISQNTTYGSIFRAEADMDVTALGLWDQGEDGLNFAHDIGIWDSSQQLLALTTVPAATTGTLVDGFRYTPISQVSLTAGQSYVIGAFY